MPRKATKSKINRKTMSLSTNMELDFLAIPTKLPAQLNKELKVLKKQEKKLESSLSKMQKQRAKAENKYAALASKAKNKTQANAAKKLLDKLTQAAAKLSDQLNGIKQHGNLLSLKQAKFTAICNYIASIEQKWEKKYAKANKVKTTVKAKAGKPKKAHTKKSHRIAEELITEMPHRNEPARMDITPEMAEASSQNE